MSQDAIEHILGKTILNAPFRNLFFSDPDRALSDFTLTDKEESYLKRMDAESLELLADIIEERGNQWHISQKTNGG